MQNQIVIVRYEILYNSLYNKSNESLMFLLLSVVIFHWIIEKVEGFDIFDTTYKL